MLTIIGLAISAWVGLFWLAYPIHLIIKVWKSHG